MAANIAKNPDEDYLRLLSIFHYVLGAMNAFAGCFPVIHITLGIAMLAGAFDNDPNPPPRELGFFFAGIGGAISLFCWMIAAAKFFAGRSLARHTNYRYCYVVAALECLQMPTGTALGVCTILVLSKPSVQALFAGIPYRDPRQAALEQMGEDEDLPPRPGSTIDDGSIRAG